MADKSNKEIAKKGLIVPSIVATVLAIGVYFAVPGQDWKMAVGAWVGTFFVWSVWVMVMGLY
ncbi:MAG: hypothetical protein AAGB46_05780 [Verrucomicrobiota bacterium]